MEQYLVHHGIRGQKWGIRRFQNKDGSLTSEGKKRYDAYNESDRLKKNISSANSKLNAAGEKLINSSSSLKKGFGSIKNVDDIENLYLQAANGKPTKEFKEFDKAYDNYLAAKKQSRVFDKENAKAIKEGEKIVRALTKETGNESKEKLKKAAIIGGAAIGTALGAYGAYKMSENNRMNKEAASKALRVIKNDLSVVSHTPIDRVKIDRVPISRSTIQKSLGTYTLNDLKDLDLY